MGSSPCPSSLQGMSARPFAPLLMAPLMAVLAALPWPARALNPGDLMFAAYNASEDGWTLVALVDLAPATKLFFSDNNWDGKAFSSGEGFLGWDSGKDLIKAGTVVRFSKIDSAFAQSASFGTLERVLIPGSTAPNLKQAGDTLYAYQGPDALTPKVFIAAISGDAFLAAEGTLQGTGLAPGAAAVSLPVGTKFAEATGVNRSGSLTNLAAQAQLSNAANWTPQSSGNFVSAVPEVTSFNVSVVPQPAAWQLALVGGSLLALARLGRKFRARRGPTPTNTGLATSPNGSFFDHRVT